MPELTSPAVVHSMIPRPRSPRVPLGLGGRSMLSAERFSAVANDLSFAERQRSLDNHLREMEDPAELELPKRPVAKQKSPDKKKKRTSASPASAQPPARPRSPSMPRERSTQFTNVENNQKKSSPLSPAAQPATPGTTSTRVMNAADSSIKGCVRGGFALGRGLTECFATVNDIYKVECGTSNRNRGDDRMFLSKGQNRHSIEEDNSIQDTTGSTSTLQHARNRSQDIFRKKSEISAPTDEDTLHTKLDFEPVVQTTPSLVPPSPPSSPEPQPETTHRSRRYLRREKVQELLNRSREEHSHTKLRNARLELVGAQAPPAANTAKALIDNSLESKQAMDISGDTLTIRQELEETRMALLSTRRELHEVRQVSARQHEAIADTSTKIFQERLQVEEKLRKVMKDNYALKEQVDRLQSQSVKAETWSQGEYISETSSAVSHTEFVTLKAEIAELRAQLGDARSQAVALETDNSDLRRDKGRVEDQIRIFQQEMDSLRVELESVRELAGASQAQEDKAKFMLRRELDTIKVQLEESNKRATQVTKKHHELEIELSKSHVEGDKLKKEVARFMQQLDKSKSDARVSEREAKILQEQVRIMKNQLTESHLDVVTQATHHLKARQAMEEDLIKSQKVAESLRQTVESLDDQIARSEHESAVLLEKLERDIAEKTLSDESKARVVEMMRRLR